MYYCSNREIVVNKPNQNLVARKSIKLLLKSLVATEDDLPLKAEALVSEAIILLQQLDEFDIEHNPKDLKEKFLEVREIFYGKL